MCFGSKNNAAEPAPRPAQAIPSSNPKASMPQDYAPPSGPPPSHSNNYAPPPGPPPSHSQAQARDQDYAPPAGPPPSKSNNPFLANPSQDYAPPPGPPPTQAPKQHDWQTAVPDTALLPPPPSFFTGFDRSPANNATEQQAEAGESWCAQFPLYPSMPHDDAAAAAAATGNVALYAPPTLAGPGKLTQAGPGVWRVLGEKGAPDASLASYPPLYLAAAHDPRRARRPRTAYYEVRVLEQGSRKDEISLALGFAAPPYPGFRLPGWHRGSLGVHGDDGHRYVNDRWGGHAFAKPFRRGEVLGLGMTFSEREGGGGGIRVQIFLTRDGREAGRWDLHEETDREQDLPVTGLEGYHDVCASVGCFDKVAFEVVFRPDAWVWKGYQG
ncbi:hypothetical protein GGR54DRAFT_653003 [Hypoxylon sp. NC1633]|nr:hypothetical protein GGR54DRAFT_653003 [Hypoxylon sp. NC1633]